jgi:hypothetical protein
MMLRTALAAAALGTALFATPSAAQQSTATNPTERTFSARLDALLVDSRDQKRGLVFHVGGEKIPGVVKEFAGDAIIVANQEYSRILIRRDAIVAVEGN